MKADPGKHGPADEFPVMKLNLVKDYQTGIYDYNDMLSTFVALAPVNRRLSATPTKSIVLQSGMVRTCVQPASVR